MTKLKILVLSLIVSSMIICGMIWINTRSYQKTEDFNVDVSGFSGKILGSYAKLDNVPVISTKVPIKEALKWEKASLIYGDLNYQNGDSSLYDFGIIIWKPDPNITGVINIAYYLFPIKRHEIAKSVLKDNIISFKYFFNEKSARQDYLVLYAIFFIAIYMIFIAILNVPKSMTSCGHE